MDKVDLVVVVLLRRILSRVYRFMDSIIFSYSSQQDDGFFSNSFDNQHKSQGLLDSVESLFLVSFSWWKEAVCDGGIAGEIIGVPRGVLYNATVHFNRAGREEEQGEAMEGYGEPEITVDIRREGEAGIAENLAMADYTKYTRPRNPNQNNFISSTFRGLDCTASSQVSVPAAIRTSANWEAKKVKRKVLKTKKSSGDSNANPLSQSSLSLALSSSCVSAPDVWCGHGIGLTTDAASVDCAVSRRPPSVSTRGKK